MTYKNWKFIIYLVNFPRDFKTYFPPNLFLPFFDSHQKKRAKLSFWCLSSQSVICFSLFKLWADFLLFSIILSPVSYIWENILSGFWFNWALRGKWYGRSGDFRESWAFNFRSCFSPLKLRPFQNFIGFLWKHPKHLSGFFVGKNGFFTTSLFTNWIILYNCTEEYG